MNCGGGSSVRINPIGIIFMLVIFVIIVYFNFGSNDTRASLLNDRVTTEAVSLKALLSVAIEMARRGGVEVKRIREQVNAYRTTDFALNSVKYYALLIQCNFIV